MGDAGTMSVAASNNLTTSGVQAVTGAKTFNDQTLKLRNPLDTFTTTVINPAITANRNLTIPDITANDTFVTTGLAQTITAAKTFNHTTQKLVNPAATFTGTLLHPRITSTQNLEYGYTGFGSYIAYRDAVGNYVAKDLTTHAIASSTGVAETAIQTAITNAGQYGTVFLVGVNPFTLSGAFTGFNVLYHQTIHMGAGTRINVPNGYTGSLFKFSQANTCAHAKLIGGLLSEQGTAANLWTAIDIDSNATTQAFDITIDGTRIVNASRGIKITTDATGWSNANHFTNMYIENCVVGIEFVHTGTFTAAQSGVNTNLFGPMTIQAVSASTNGIKDVNGRRNVFFDCYVVDFSGADIGCNITANAQNTQIIGGTVTALNFADLTAAGSETWIRDEYQGDVGRIRKTLTYEDNVVTTAPSNPASGTTRRYTKTIDANNDGLFVKRRLNGAVVEVQL